MNKREFTNVSDNASEVSSQYLSKNVDFYDIMDFAILKEEEAYNVLLGLCKKMENPEAKKALNRLASEELEHIKVLQKLIAGGPGNFKATKVTFEKYQDQEFSDVLKEDATVKEVLEFTIAKEKDSYLFYNDMARAYKDKETKDTLLNLANLEKAHQTRLEKIYYRYFQPN